jgi:hypothetical protein
VPVVDVADGVQPVTAAHAHRVVDVEPRAGLEADGLEPDVARPRHAARRDEDLGCRDRSVASVTVDGAVAASARDTASPRRRSAPRRPPRAQICGHRVAANGSIPTAGRSARSS